jgi:hypothetical protein
MFGNQWSFLIYKEFNFESIYEVNFRELLIKTEIKFKMNWPILEILSKLMFKEKPPLSLSPPLNKTLNKE